MDHRPYYLQIADPQGIGSLSEPLYGWQTVGRFTDPQDAYRMRAHVGTGVVPGDGYFVARVVSSTELGAEGGDELVDQANFAIEVGEHAGYLAELLKAAKAGPP